MSHRREGLWPVHGGVLDELLAALDAGLGGRTPRALSRLAKQVEFDAAAALQELDAFPARTCAAIESGLGLVASRCRAGSGCTVADECPLVRGGGPERIAESALAQLAMVVLERATGAVPAAPVTAWADLRRAVCELLERSGALRADAPPRASIPLVLLDRAAGRGDTLGIVSALLSAEELSRIAAFVPPGSGRDHATLAAVEAWLRYCATAEFGLLCCVESADAVRGAGARS